VKKESVDARAGRLLARTRAEANLTQAEVATRADLPQSTVSAYESGRRQPTLPMLSKLLEAMGAEVTIAASPLPAALTVLTGPTGVRIRRHRQLITEAAAGHGAQNVRVLDMATAPVELLVDRIPEATVVRLPDLAAELQEIIGAPVEVIATEDLSPARQAEADRRSVAL
jgi:transcriptional regulator with XRE-family HTH domain